ncbi:uncharacterized protein BDCG_09277 [Blastomyces dermatitidis ER-3]|uniref:RING-type domain-containing protein n=2 Tax=Blastomyces TaxID=229219 RepID=A0A179UYQ9_BLAGS|nr:uncharacterized protein BDBG_08463 [Blastomyces gilchristii SLH14081]XP_045273638.1 uncharacterized protein BDCG_09277 [Blastomyces dermatitidis ER-3]EEQ86008.1 hypothetical protein BDCG_09277 [Blastomyces dermatitidis ER-3]OAT13214.1 hypothetical protein BDBG_08463 [Blastomyces gilchristii SLH14081]
MVRPTQLAEMYGDFSNVDPRLVVALEKIHAEDPRYKEPEVPELTTTDPEEGICIVCRCAWFLPLQFGPCGHVFCAECLWNVLFSHASDADPSCMLCRSTQPDFRYRSEIQTISADRSDFDRGRIYLIILFMKLQLLHGAWFDWDMGSDEYKMFEVNRDTDVEDIQGINTETLTGLREEEDHWATRPAEEGDNDQEEDSEEEHPGLLEMILHRIPVHAL